MQDDREKNIADRPADAEEAPEPRSARERLLGGETPGRKGGTRAPLRPEYPTEKKRDR